MINLCSCSAGLLPTERMVGTLSVNVVLLEKNKYLEAAAGNRDISLFGSVVTDCVTVSYLT